MYVSAVTASTTRTSRNLISLIDIDQDDKIGFKGAAPTVSAYVYKFIYIDIVYRAHIHFPHRAQQGATASAHNPQWREDKLPRKPFSRWKIKWTLQLCNI